MIEEDRDSWELVSHFSMCYWTILKSFRVGSSGMLPLKSFLSEGSLLFFCELCEDLAALLPESRLAWGPGQFAFRPGLNPQQQAKSLASALPRSLGWVTEVCEKFNCSFYVALGRLVN